MNRSRVSGTVAAVVLALLAVGGMAGGAFLALSDPEDAPDAGPTITGPPAEAKLPAVYAMPGAGTPRPPAVTAGSDTGGLGPVPTDPRGK